jgi:hypothetical protein
MDSDTTAEEYVRTMLTKEGLTVPEDEIAEMTLLYTQMFGNAEKLYFDAVKYESPALIYSAKPA